MQLSQALGTILLLAATHVSADAGCKWDYGDNIKGMPCDEFVVFIRDSPATSRTISVTGPKTGDNPKNELRNAWTAYECRNSDRAAKTLEMPEGFKEQAKVQWAGVCDGSWNGVKIQYKDQEISVPKSAPGGYPDKVGKCTNPRSTDADVVGGRICRLKK